MTALSAGWDQVMKPGIWLGETISHREVRRSLSEGKLQIERALS